MICYEIEFWLRFGCELLFKISMRLWMILCICVIDKNVKRNICVIDFTHMCLKLVYDFCTKYAFMYMSVMVMSKPLVWLNGLCFLLDSSEDKNPKAHGWCGTIIVSLVNRLIAKFV